MRQIKTLLAAGVITAAAALSRHRRRHLGRRRHLPLSDLRQVGGRLQEGDRQRAELSVDRLRRRHQADHRPDRDLRRLRHAAEAGRTRQDRPHPVPDRDGRRRAGGQSRRHQERRHHARRCRRSPRSSSARSRRWNDPAIQKLNPKAKLPTQAIAVVHRSDGSGTTFIFTNYLSKVSADWKSKVGSQHVGGMAGRHRRQGQRRRRQQRRQHQGLDRLRRIPPTPSRTS